MNYESPAAYGLTILYVLHRDTNFAKELYEQMTTFRNDNVFSRYYGGYVTGENNNTHIFDNVLPLLAEIELEKSKNKMVILSKYICERITIFICVPLRQSNYFHYLQS